jgi:hypothetical protein
LHGPFTSYVEVLKLLDKAEAGDAAAIMKIAELQVSLVQELKKSDREDLLFWASVIKPMDKHASTVFGDGSNMIGEMTLEYIIPLSSHQQSVVEMLQKSWGLSSDKGFEENTILMHLDRVVARMLLYLMPEEGKAHAPLPLLGEFVMTNAWESFVSIQDGIGEVSALL